LRLINGKNEIVEKIIYNKEILNKINEEIGSEEVVDIKVD